MSEPVMPTTSFRLLHDAGACKERYRFLAKALGGIKAYGVNTPITLLQILDINGFDDALWALRACPDADTFARLLACDYAEHVLPIFETQYPDDDRPRKAIAVSRRYARGEATDAELSAAWYAADSAAEAAWYAAEAAGYAAWYAARSAARDAGYAGYAAEAAERTWQEARLRELLERGQESSGKPTARSRCGAVGLTQIRWKYWSETLINAGVCETETDLLVPETAIEAGAYILRTLLDRYGDIDRALKHYSGNARNYTDKVIGRVTG